jgi:L-fucose mutarotase
MLENVSKLLTGDLLKILCDMGHGDTIVIADANFPGNLNERQLRYPGVNVGDILKAIMDIFPFDYAYTENPVCAMEMTDNDKKRGIPTPPAWGEFEEIIGSRYEGKKLGHIDRFEFYEKTKKAYAVVITGEERIYGNLLITKGCVL